MMFVIVVVALALASSTTFARLSDDKRRELLTNSNDEMVDGFKTYAGYQVVKFPSITALEIQGMEDELFIDIWDVEPSIESDDKFAVTAAVSAGQLGLMMMGDEYKYEVLIDDLSTQIMSEHKRLKNKENKMSDIKVEFFEDFRTYEEIHAYYREMVAAYPQISSITTLGRTDSNREILGVRLFNGTSTTATKKLFIECSIHAREWISAPTCAWQLKMLLEGFGNDADSNYILNNFAVLIVPVTNPDGYAYTWSNDRMWRKNRVAFTGTTCRGVDLNRNWPSHWTASANQCSDTYPGVTRASELETKAIGVWIESQANVQFNIDFHAYGELILRPWGNTVTASPDEAVLKQLGDGMRDAIRTVHNNLYVSQRSAQLYPANGETTDYYYDTVRVGTSGTKTKAWGFTYELRGNSFVIDADEIIPQGEEIWAGFVFAARFTAANPPQ